MVGYDREICSVSEREIIIVTKFTLDLLFYGKLKRAVHSHWNNCTIYYPVDLVLRLVNEGKIFCAPICIWQS